MKIERCFEMPSKFTFTIPIVQEVLSQFDFKKQKWCDPFAGNNSPASHTNDMDTNTKAKNHLEAINFLNKQKDKFFDGVLYDPPYSISQAAQYGPKYKSKQKFGNMNYWSKVKDELQRILKPKGIAICFGWSSTGLGKGRGFDIEQIYLINHGGSKNDTIVTIEKKLRLPAKWPKVGKAFK